MMHVHPLTPEVSRETRLRDALFKPATLRSAALVTADLCGFLIAAGAAFMINMIVEMRTLSGALQQAAEQGFIRQGWSTVLVMLLLAAYFGIRGHYTARVPIWTELRVLVFGAMVGFLCDSYAQVVLQHTSVELGEALRWIVLVPCLLFTRNLARAVLDDLGLWRLRTLVIGDNSAIAPMQAAFLSEPRLGYEVVASIGLQGSATAHVHDRGARLLKQHEAEFAVVAIGGDMHSEAARIAEELSRERVPFALVPVVDGLPVSAFSSHYFITHDVMLLVYGNTLARPVCRFIKMLFDQFMALLLLLVLSPLFLALAFLVRADGGPVLFGHRRVGENGRHFSCLKFRSMVLNADSVLQQVLSSDPEARAEWEATHKLHNDPRITPIGRVLRKTSLDELPQLLNVLRGEMSLVGPRPIIDAEIPRYGRNISYYFEAKPGITGLWQVSGRSNTTYEHRVHLDVWYVRNWSLWHDIAILLKTLPAVLKKEGAV